MTSLYQKDIKAVSKADVDLATTAVHSAQSERAAAKADTAAAQAQLEVADAGVTNAQASVHDAQLQLSYTRILAPAPGRLERKAPRAVSGFNPARRSSPSSNRTCG